MIDIGVGLSIEKNTVLAGEEAVRRAKRNKRGNVKTDLAIVFCSADLPYATLLKTLNDQLDDTPLIGLSGAAIFGWEGVFTHGVLLMLLSFPPDIYSTISCIKDLKSRPVQQSGVELGEKLLYGFKNVPRSLGLTLFDRVIEEGYGFISGMQEHLGTSFPCLGACASDPFTPTRNRLLYNQAALSDACGGLLLGGKLNFGFGIHHGWKPLGKPRTVTGASGSVIRTIDGMPAVKLYEEYLATTSRELKREIWKLSVFYPIGVKIEGESEYLIRNVVFIDDDGSLHCQGNIPEGSPIRLMISTKETCLNAAETAIDETLRLLSSPSMKLNKEQTSKFAVAFSSFSRYTLMRRDADKEVLLMKQALGSDIPFIGIYTASELAPLHAQSYHGHVYFHNQTFSFLMVEG